MAETTESVRQDSSRREDQQKEVTDWGGKRFKPPRGTTLPSTAQVGEIFILENDNGKDRMYTYDSQEDAWSTVGPRSV